MKENYFFPKFCEPPKRRMDSIRSSCDGFELLLDRLLLSMDVDRRLFDSFDTDTGDGVPSPTLPIIRIVRYSVIVFPKGFGATRGGDGCCWARGEARAINCLRSLSTVT